jgi:hypothetical protein
MKLEPTLEKMRELLRPSGKLIVLGLYQERTIVDYLYSAISVPLNFIYLTWHQASGKASTTVAPTRPAQLSLRQIKTAADILLPRSSLKRHLFWRYSLIWQKQ